MVASGAIILTYFLLRLPFTHTEVEKGWAQTKTTLRLGKVPPLAYEKEATLDLRESSSDIALNVSHFVLH